MIVLDVFGNGVHLVRGRREQNDPGRFPTAVLEREQLLSELAGRLIRLQQMLESLELVEDDQIRLERLNGDPGKLITQSAHEASPIIEILIRPAPAFPAKAMTEIIELLPKSLLTAPPRSLIVALEGAGECLGQLGIERSLTDVAQVPPEVRISPNRASEDVAGSSAANCLCAPRDPQEAVEQRALVCSSARRFQVERGSRRERHEIEAVFRQLMEYQGKQRDPRSQDEVVFSRDVQASDVLARDLRVRAHVDDVHPPDIALKMLDRFRDEPAGDQRLAKTNLVGHQESGFCRRPGVQPVEDVLDSVALEVLEAGVDVAEIESDAPHVPHLFRASMMGSQTDSSPSGMRSRPSSVACETSDQTGNWSSR